MNMRPSDRAIVHLVRLAIQNLAGVPAIVFGLFGLGFFIEFVGRGIDKAFYGGELVYGQPAIIWAALTLALLTMPTVVVATEEALRAIPQSYREVAYSLGATRWQMIRRVVLPQAVGGILTGRHPRHEPGFGRSRSGHVYGSRLFSAGAAEAV